MPSKSFTRTDRVSAQLRKELAVLVHAAVRDHALPSVSVSDVEVTRDMAHAKVFVTALQPERSAEAVKGLREAAKEIRYELARAVKLRHVPELHFVYDESLDRGEKIDRLLEQVRPRSEDGDPRRRYLGRVWRELIGVAAVAPQDNFFDVGGHSLLAVELAARVQRETGVRLNLLDIASSTLAALAEQLPEPAVAGQNGHLGHRLRRLLGLR